MNYIYIFAASLYQQKINTKMKGSNLPSTHIRLRGFNYVALL